MVMRQSVMIGKKVRMMTAKSLMSWKTMRATMTIGKMILAAVIGKKPIA